MPISKKHPKGLYVLFSTEMWERFNFYGMRSIMGLYMVYGLGFSEANASKIYGAYLGLGYLTTMFGGKLADKYWGNRKCLYVGSVMMIVAQFLLFVSASVFSANLSLSIGVFWLGVILLIIGMGIFKPNISSMVGDLYEKKDKHLDNAYTIFYMGINLGALLGQIICSELGDVKKMDINGKAVRDLMAFRWGFLSASIAMFLGLVSFDLLKKYLINPKGANIGLKPFPVVVQNGEFVVQKEERKDPRKTALFTFVLTIVLTFIFSLFTVDGQNKGWDKVIPFVYAFIYGLGISLVLQVLLDRTLTAEERGKVSILIICSFFVIFFWAAFEQAGSSLTFIANNQTDTTIWGHTFPPSQIQVLNGLFIILLAPVAVALWSFLAKYKLEPSSFVKQALGLILLALGYYIIALAVVDLKQTDKISIVWFIILYLLHTMGELCLSPIGLSLVYKLSPKRIVGLLLGIWFVAGAAGYALAGTLGSLLPQNPEQFRIAQEKGIDLQLILDKKIKPSIEQLQILKKENINPEYPHIIGIEIQNLYQFFMVFVILSFMAGIILLFISKRLNKVAKL